MVRNGFWQGLEGLSGSVRAARAQRILLFLSGNVKNMSA